MEQYIGSYDIGLDELTGAVDGAVDMGLGGEMHDPFRPEIGERLAHGVGVADVGLKELVVRIALKIRQGSRVARIGELVDV